MTNERAIELLNRISDSQFDGQHGNERREALEMAVRALEQNLVQESDSLVKDLISRKMAIGAIEEMQMPIMRLKWESDQFKFSALAEVREMISELPSAQPQLKTARWEILYPNHTYKYHCSECGANHKYMFDFCPSCGARMED